MSAGVNLVSLIAPLLQNGHETKSCPSRSSLMCIAEAGQVFGFHVPAVLFVN